MSALDPNKCNRRIYVINNGDDLSLQKALQLETKISTQEKSSVCTLALESVIIFRLIDTL